MMDIDKARHAEERRIRYDCLMRELCELRAKALDALVLRRINRIDAELASI